MRNMSVTENWKTYNWSFLIGWDWHDPQHDRFVRTIWDVNIGISTVSYGPVLANMSEEDCSLWMPRYWTLAL